METERKYFNQDELTPEEVEDVIDVTNYILTQIEQEEIFSQELDPSQPSQVVKYKDRIESLKSDFREKQIENQDKFFISDIVLNDEKGIEVKTIKFFVNDNEDVEKIKHLDGVSIEAVCERLNLENRGVLDTPNYENFLRAMEYLRKDIRTTKSLKRFLENPGIYFKYSRDGRVFPSRGVNGRAISLYEKGLKLSAEEKASIEGWKYVKTFEHFNPAFIFNEKLAVDYLSRLVESYLKLEKIDEKVGLYSDLSFLGTNLVMIVSKQEEF